MWVQCRYNAVNFLTDTGIHNRHPIAHLWGQGMGCLLVQALINVLLWSLQWWIMIYALSCIMAPCTVYPKNYAHGFVVLCFVVVMQLFIMNSPEVFIHIHQGCFAGTGAIVRLPQCQWSKPDGYGKISQCITTTKHSKAKTVCIFLGIYCITNDTPPDTAKTFGLSPFTELRIDFGLILLISNMIIQEFYWSYSSFISQCQRTGKFHSFCSSVYGAWVDRY